MSDSGEATINPDGTTSTTTTTTTTTTEEEEPMIMNETTSTIHEENEPKNNFDTPPQDEIPDPTTLSSSSTTTTTDPAIYLALSFIVIVILYVLQYKRQKKKIMDRESFFMDLDGDKFTNIKLPDAVDEFYVVKEKCIDAGWEPGKVSRIRRKEEEERYISIVIVFCVIFLTLQLYTSIILYSLLQMHKKQPMVQSVLWHKH